MPRSASSVVPTRAWTGRRRSVRLARAGPRPRLLARLDVERLRLVLPPVLELIEPDVVPAGDGARPIVDDPHVTEPGFHEHGRQVDPVVHPLMGLTPPAGIAEHEVLDIAPKRLLLGGAR